MRTKFLASRASISVQRIDDLRAREQAKTRNRKLCVNLADSACTCFRRGHLAAFKNHPDLIFFPIAGRAHSDPSAHS